VGTLVLRDLEEGVLARIPDVNAFAVEPGTRELYYRQVTSDSDRLTTLHYRSKDGFDRALGLSDGAVEFHGNRLYFIAGEDDPKGTPGKVLARFTRPDGAIEVLHDRVRSFLVAPDESWLIFQTIGGSRPETIARRLATGEEHRVPATERASWMELSSTAFVYSEPPVPPDPRGTIHRHDLLTGAEEVTRAPAGLVDVREMRQRPSSHDRLYTDSEGQLAVVPEGEVDGRRIGDNPAQVSITEDGRYALWIDIVASGPRGKLMIQDLDFRAPPRQLSPPGAMVAFGYTFIADGARRILVYSAELGSNGDDLYYADHETGQQRRVAEGISGALDTRPYRLMGVVRASGQDLTGELVDKDLALEREVVLAHEVAAYTALDNRVAFVVRGRVSSSRDGLWAIDIDDAHR
jgi:hypothetical protein